MEQNGKTLSATSSAVFKGGTSHNGTLLKLHEFSYTIGYSALLKADGSAAGTVKFGNGVFFDATQGNNRAYVGSPTVTGAVPVFGGIVVREPAIAGGYPVLNDEVAGFQKGLLCKDGFVIYKEAKTCFASSGLSSAKEKLYGKIYSNFCLWINKTNGEAYFSPKSTVYNASGDILVGRVVEVNPDDESVTVHICSANIADTTDIAGATPTLTLGTTTDTKIPISTSQGVPNDVVISYKKHADSTYVVLATLTPTLSGSDYVASIDLEGLTANTSYDVKAEVYSACGLKSDTATKSTQAAS